MLMNIREATITDVPVIIEIAEQTWWPTYGPILSDDQISYMLGVLYSVDKISSQLSTGEQTYVVLTEGEQVLAFAAYSPREEDPEIYKLHKLYCLPKTQGKGYGKILIDEVSKRVLSAGKHILDLNVNRYNKAKSFYEKMGFAIVYEEDIPIGLYWMNDYVMRKEL
jgi:GNAT superfamily N-acetyltransferase